MTPLRILVTGGSGFIGSALIRQLIATTPHQVLNLDVLTYAAVPGGLDGVVGDGRYAFEKTDIRDGEGVARVVRGFQPDGVIHLAAESHVDRSIDNPPAFIETNIVGTGHLLEACLGYWRGLGESEQKRFRFLHVSTDEVFGSLGAEGRFSETSPYDPRSPYSASKASADHLVRAWHHTYGLPILISNCSNNYGPFQFPEKLIPLIISRAVDGQLLPVYGDGGQVRDWLHVDDHARALLTILQRGRVGESWLVGGFGEKTNLEVVTRVCRILDQLRPDSPHRPHEDLISFVADRPGHDRRYAVASDKLQNELGWQPQHAFETGLEETVVWYLEREAWWREILGRRYRGQRLGLGRESHP
ncbi:MAG: dTDP-glucose 4,6-dehydratase [Magnetococcales bacterium]|nr:dTDP-glucose 4,6-dehydratase [Magnetococcales bacterium]